MAQLIRVAEEIVNLVEHWESILHQLDLPTVAENTNDQGRNVRQILGHLIDSASNNLHRIIHLQYQPSPLVFPDYANLGVNNRWIALQNYSAEGWSTLLPLWKYSNLHLAHVITNIRDAALGNVWISALGEHISLEAMVVDYPRHLQLHLEEIRQLAEVEGPLVCSGDSEQLQYYLNKLRYEIDAFDLAKQQELDGSVVVLDMRSGEFYDREHIPGAISLPHRQISQQSTSNLDRSKLYVTYCDGIGCNASTKGAQKMTSLGFRVKELLGGIDWWKRDGYPTSGSQAVTRGTTSCGC